MKFIYYDIYNITEHNNNELANSNFNSLTAEGCLTDECQHCVENAVKASKTRDDENQQGSNRMTIKTS